MKWYLKTIKENYANFSGRARRKEYWMFTLISGLISLILYAIMFGGIKMDNQPLTFIGGALYRLYILAVLVPSLAVKARRLHDIGRSAWWYLIIFTGIGVIVLLVLFCTDSEVGENQWGPYPKARESGHILKPVNLIIK